MFEMLIGGLLITAGYFLCYFTNKKGKTRYTDVITKVKRVKPSLRNPLKTYEVSYEKYKSRDSNLYQPSKPNRGDTA